MTRFIFCLFFLFNSLYASENYLFNDETKAAQFHGLTYELRCMVCSHQNLAESSAPLAMDMKTLIYQKVLDGESDSEIIAYLTARYGDAILFKPPLKALTWLLWFGPALFFILGLFIVYKLSFRMKQSS